MKRFSARLDVDNIQGVKLRWLSDGVVFNEIDIPPARRIEHEVEEPENSDVVEVEMILAWPNGETKISKVSIDN